MAYTTINKSSDYFNTKLYSGSASSQSITGVGFQPDLIIVKNRTTTGNHYTNDIIRGASQKISTNSASAEFTQDGISSFDSDGFTVGTASTDTNNSGNNYVSWNWLANNTSGSSNTDGSITSTVSANTTSGFSIVSYSGNSTAGATVGHGLGVVPKMIIVKHRNNVNDWKVYHVSLGATDHITLNSTDGTNSSITLWNNTAPTSTVFSLGTNGNINGSGGNYIAYCFAEKQGFSKFGSYIGNGTSGTDGAGDGTFIYTGFKPAMIIIKPSSTTGNWQILDNKRPGFNESDNLAPNNNAAENTSNDFVDLVSNGFKLRSGTYSASGTTYIYMAFGQSLVGSNNVPCTAR